MSIQMILLDLDGTLLTSDKRLSPGNRAALERAAARGVHIVPSTGRFYSGMPQVVRELRQMSPVWMHMLEKMEDPYRAAN